MLSRCKVLISIALLALGAGCQTDRPHEYGQQRPPLDQLDERDRGLQSKDVLVATDKMSSSLLALPELNQSRAQWTVVLAPFQDHTIDRRGKVNYDIFIERLRSNLGKQGRGRIALIENLETVDRLRDRELRGGRGDEFGQGGGDRNAPAELQPDFVLYGKAYDMPNRGTNYYQLQFILTDFNTRRQIWNDDYEVRVARK